MQQQCDDDLIAHITKLVEEFELHANYSGCIDQLVVYESEKYSNDVRYIAILNHITCAMRANRFAEAKLVLKSANRNDFSVVGCIYLDKLLVQILEHDRDFEGARDVLLDNLTKPEMKYPDNREVYYDMIGLMIRILSRLGDYLGALAYFDRGSEGFEAGPSLDSFNLYRAYSLRMLGRDKEAEACLKTVLKDGSGTLIVDAFYDLGILYWKSGRVNEAQLMLRCAQENIPNGLKTADDINRVLVQLESNIGADVRSQAPN